MAGLSEYLWRLEQPAHAVANGYFIGAINRIGHEQPWDIGEFYGQSYFCDPRGQFVAEAPRDKDALSSSRISISTRFAKCATRGSSSAIAVRIPTAH